MPKLSYPQMKRLNAASAELVNIGASLRTCSLTMANLNGSVDSKKWMEAHLFILSVNRHIDEAIQNVEKARMELAEMKDINDAQD